MYVALRTLRVEAQLVTYAREGHSVEEREHQLDVVRRLVGCSRNTSTQVEKTCNPPRASTPDSSVRTATMDLQPKTLFTGLRDLSQSLERRRSVFGAFSEPVVQSSKR